MAASDDLSSLFAQPEVPVGFRQGKVIAWDPGTGANTIDVGGALLSDVPVLNTAEAITLKPGHVVGLLRVRAQLFILGRVTVPGSSEYASASVAFEGWGSSTIGIGLATTYSTKTSGALDVPPWADEALILATANASIDNNSGADDYCQLLVEIDGISGGTATTLCRALTDKVSLAASAQRLVTTPGATIALAARMRSSTAAWPTDPLGIVNLDAIAVYRSA